MKRQLWAINRQPVDWEEQVHAYRCGKGTSSCYHKAAEPRPWGHPPPSLHLYPFCKSYLHKQWLLSTLRRCPRQLPSVHLMRRGHLKSQCSVMLSNILLQNIFLGFLTGNHIPIYFSDSQLPVIFPCPSPTLAQETSLSYLHCFHVWHWQLHRRMHMWLNSGAFPSEHKSSPSGNLISVQLFPQNQSSPVSVF